LIFARRSRSVLGRRWQGQGVGWDHHRLIQHQHVIRVRPAVQRTRRGMRLGRSPARDLAWGLARIVLVQDLADRGQDVLHRGIGGRLGAGRDRRQRHL